jgi:hypothetical protein
LKINRCIGGREDAFASAQSITFYFLHIAYFYFNGDGRVVRVYVCVYNYMRVYARQNLWLDRSQRDDVRYPLHEHRFADGLSWQQHLKRSAARRAAFGRWTWKLALEAGREGRKQGSWVLG